MTVADDWIMAMVGALAVGGIVGLIKHAITDEGTRQRIADLEGEIAGLRTTIDAGILPRTDERLRALEREIDDLKRQP